MKLIYLFSLFFLFTITAFPQGYYPLEMGNVWEYRDIYDSTYQSTEKVVGDTTMQNGFTYAVIVANGVQEEGYTRQEGSKVYSYTKNRINDSVYQYSDELVYDFSKTTGDTVTVKYYPMDTVTIEVIGDGMINVFGKMRRVWTFYETSQNTSIYYVRYVADSIGLIKWEGEPGLAFGLFGAIINGTQYGTITSIEPQPLVLNSFKLYQNYPNPFNPSTIITLKILSQRNISLIIYNMLGEQIKKLFEGDLSAGEHRILWNGRDDFGHQVVSGIYFYQLKTGNFIETKKMILLR